MQKRDHKGFPRLEQAIEVKKIRTYNFKDNRTTDHRLGSNFSLEPILAGQLEEVINACIAQEQKRMMEDFNKEVN